MFRKTKKTAAKITSLILSAAIVFPMLHGLSISSFVRADDTVEKTASNTKTGVDGLHDPATPSSAKAPWQGSYVYFGNYHRAPLKFRVLASSQDAGSGKQVMFLDSDGILDLSRAPFAFQEESNKWLESDTRSYLNSTFLNDAFLPLERDAIPTTYKAGGVSYDPSSWIGSMYSESEGLNDQIFVLDAEDVLNETYGYYNAVGSSTFQVLNHKKEYTAGAGGGNTGWLLRNYCDQYVTAEIGIVNSTGGLDTSTTGFPCIAPALNVSHESILFSTAINGTYGELGTEYKLTLIDPNMKTTLVNGSSVQLSENRVYFEQTLSGATNADKTSFIITTGPIGSANNSIIDYGVYHGGNGSYYLDLPNDLAGTWGEDFYVYVFVEDINGKYETDYASNPVELPKPVSGTAIVFDGKTVSNTKLGVDQISNPRIPTSGDDAWQGSYVYYGKYDGEPIKFRVLNRATSDFRTDGGKSVFLDSDKVLFSSNFDGDLDTGVAGSNVWAGSDLQLALNGNAFLTKSNGFSEVEQDSLLESNADDRQLSGVPQDVKDEYQNYVGLSDEKVFVLDVEDVFNLENGYCDYTYLPSDYCNYHKVALNGSYTSYWLRNAYCGESQQPFAAYVMYYSASAWQVNDSMGVAPALNVDQDSILFSTAVRGTYGELGTEYKLTLLDPEIILTVEDGSVSRNGNRISFNDTHSGSHVVGISQGSYLITTKTLGSDANSILDYGMLHGGNGTAFFDLPSSITGTWGIDYHVYVFLEKTNGACETDYASIPVELDNPEFQPIAGGKTSDNTKIGVDGIHDPATPSSVNDAWQGSYVYYGKYSGRPVKYRVLDTDSSLYASEKTLFLDSDKVMFEASFDSTGTTNVWNNSRLRSSMNSSSGFLVTGFVSLEREIIYKSTVAGHSLQISGPSYAGYAGLSEDKLFLLDAEDLSNTSYGYITDGTNTNGRKDKVAGYDGSSSYWLRTANSSHNDWAANNNYYGYDSHKVDDTLGVAPALNLKDSRILFSTAINGEYGALGTEYKLTILNSRLAVSVTDGSVVRNGNTISFAYNLSGTSYVLTGTDEKPTQISYVITRETWGTENNSILYYGKADASSLAAGDGTGSITLPDGLFGKCGVDYHVYILAEKIKGKYETDLSSPLTEVVVPVVEFAGKTISNTKLGVEQISDPRIPADLSDQWLGSYVYFGQYENRPIKFRVLDKDSTAFGDETTMFLDSEIALFTHPYSSNGSNQWVGSDIRDAINGSTFLDKDGVFTNPEKKAIYYSNTQTHALTGIRQDAIDWFGNAVGLNNDQVFLLDVEDVFNTEYGYIFGETQEGALPRYSNTCKWAYYGDGWADWWLRNAEVGSNTTAGFVTANGTLGTIGISTGFRAVAPALNVDHDSVLFSTAVEGTYGELETEYKLTLLDPELQVSLTGDFTKTGLKITVPYSLTGDSVNANTKMSYMVTSKALGEAGNTILAYGNMNQESSQSGSFTLFKGLTGIWGKAYHVYVFAENVNGTYESDYASAPVELAVSNPGPVFSGKTTQNTKLGTKQMKTPAVPQSANDAWNGSFVYFGKYEGQPVLYRVLDPNSNIYGSNTLFLDCDEGLYLDYFDEENQTNNWNDSDIRANLNGDSFLNKDGVFTSAEKASIAESEISGHPLTGILQSAINTYGNYVGLDGDKVFVLDAEDTFNGSYGYCNGCSDILGYTNYSKFCDGQLYACWLRNAAGSWQGTPNLCAGTIPQNPRMEVFADYAVAPALNVSQDSIIFSTAIEGSYGALGSQYKLTIEDPDIDLNVREFSISGDRVTFEYSLGGAHKDEVTQISYLVVKKATGFPKYDTIAAYGAVEPIGTHGGAFDLPDNLSGAWGQDYFVYVLAEDINGTYETDYADKVELVRPSMVYDLSNGPITCTSEQEDLLMDMYMNGLIDMDDSGDTILYDLDMNGKFDLSLDGHVLSKASTNNIRINKIFADVSEYAAVVFIMSTKPVFGGHALRLADDIGVKFNVALPDNTDSNDVYVKFVSSDGRTETATVAEDGYYIFHINCLELADEITATLYYKGTAVDTDTYTAMQYIEYIRTHLSKFSNADKLESLVDSLQAYGYYMQASDWSDGATHTPIPTPPSTITSSDIQTAKDGLAGFAIEKNLGNSGIDRSMKIALSMNSKTVLKVYVKAASGVTVTSTDCTAVDFSGVTYYEFDVTNIGPKNLGKTQTITINTNQGTATVNLPAMVYVKNMLNKDTVPENQKLALAAYYFYYSAADNY